MDGIRKINHNENYTFSIWNSLSSNFISQYRIKYFAVREQSYRITQTPQEIAKSACPYLQKDLRILWSVCYIRNYYKKIIIMDHTRFVLTRYIAKINCTELEFEKMLKQMIMGFAFLKAFISTNIQDYYYKGSTIQTPLGFLDDRRLNMYFTQLDYIFFSLLIHVASVIQHIFFIFNYKTQSKIMIKTAYINI